MKPDWDFTGAEAACWLQKDTHPFAAGAFVQQHLWCYGCLGSSLWGTKTQACLALPPVSLFYRLSSSSQKLSKFFSYFSDGFATRVFAYICSSPCWNGADSALLISYVVAKKKQNRKEGLKVGWWLQGFCSPLQPCSAQPHRSPSRDGGPMGQGPWRWEPSGAGRGIDLVLPMQFPGASPGWDTGNARR